MPSREENADLFQKMVVFKYVEDNGRKQSKDILVKRDAVAQYDAAVATAASHFAAFDDASQEIYFTCTPPKMGCQIEIPPDSWAETLPSFSVIEVQKRSKRDSSIRAVREQVAVLSGPSQKQSPAEFKITPGILFLWALEAYCCYSIYQEFSGRKGKE